MDVIERYYAAFNAGDPAEMLALVTDDLLHEPNQGEPRDGKAAFAVFLAHMNTCYRETVSEPAILYAADGSRASAEFMLEGEYLRTDDGLPEAHGQRYALRVGAFFALRDGRIARISNHYNLPSWLAQVSA